MAEATPSSSKLFSSSYPKISLKSQNIYFIKVDFQKSLQLCLEIKMPSPSVTDYFYSARPSAESITRPVEAFSQRVSSSPPFFCRCSVSVRVYATSFFQINVTATLATQSVFENGFQLFRLLKNLTQVAKPINKCNRTVWRQPKA